MIRQRKDAGTCRDKKRKKSNKWKNNSKTWGNIPESKIRKIKKILTKGKTIQAKQDIPKQRKEILPTSRGEMTRKPTNKLMQEKPNNFGLKYGNQMNSTKKKKRMDKQYHKDLKEVRK